MVQGPVAGREAIEFLKENVLDLVVTHLKMPGEISGEDLYEWIREHRPALASRAVFTMPDAGDAAVRALLHRTRVPHIQKPFQLQKFLAIVQLTLSGTAVVS